MIEKAYSKAKEFYRVRFELPSGVNARTAYLYGEFNAWNKVSHPMKRRKDGSFTLTVSLKPSYSYRFRYLLDGERRGCCRRLCVQLDW